MKITCLAGYTPGEPHETKFGTTVCETKRECMHCGFNKREAERRKRMLNQYGLTTIRCFIRTIR